MTARADASTEGGRSAVPQAAQPLTFEALYNRDLLEVVNQRGDVGLVTLWSPLRTVRRKLDEISPRILDADRSRIAVVANLYGDGMLAMFCNLLFNPQIRHLVAIGEDLGLGVPREIEAFLEHGLEDTAMLGRPVRRVRGTERVFPPVAGFDAERLRRNISFRYLGKLSNSDLAEELPAYLDGLASQGALAESERVRVEIPTSDEQDFEFKPSAVTGHQVVRTRPLDCWEELVVRTMRFGRPVELKKGRRIELLNAKAVITEPAPEAREVLARYGFDLDRFAAYQERILDPALPEDVSYTYGNRLRGYFPLPGGGSDALGVVVDLLRRDPETRNAYVSLWDTPADLPGVSGSTPCLTTLFFRRSEGRLTLATTYRAHNLLTGWLENVYGLMAILNHVAERVGMESGAITVVSNSLGIDPQSTRFELARAIEEGWSSDDVIDRESGKHTLREDPNGYFVVTVDHELGQIVAEHRYGGVLVKRYAAGRAVTIEREVAADMAVSLVSHALWLGRELTAKERLLSSGR
jgi:hypothetical protein